MSKLEEGIVEGLDEVFEEKVEKEDELPVMLEEATQEKGEEVLLDEEQLREEPVDETEEEDEVVPQITSLRSKI